MPTTACQPALASLLRPGIAFLISEGLGLEDLLRLAAEVYGQETSDRAFGEAPHTPAAAAINVLSGWYQDEDFLNAYCGPVPLDREGPVPSFRALCDRFARYSDHDRVAEELLAAGTVATNDKGQLVAQRRYHIPCHTWEALVSRANTNLVDHAGTIANNLSVDPDLRRFEGVAISERAAPDARYEFQKFTSLRAQQFLEDIDNWLEEFSLHPNDLSTTPVRLGLGIYAIEGTQP